MKRLFLIFFFVCISIIAFAVNNIFTGATDNNWGTATNWSQGTVPTATDTYITTFDATSPNCTVNASARVCNHIDFSAYINTITMTYAITVSGNISLGINMIVAGTGNLADNGTGNFTSNGKHWPNEVLINGNTKTVTFTDISNFYSLRITTPNGYNAITLQADMTVVNLYYGITTAAIGINGLFNLYVSGDITGAGTTSYLRGSTTIIMNGTGTWSVTNTVGMTNNLIFNTAGTITISGNVYYNIGTITNIASTLVTTGSTLNLGTCTLNMADATLAGLTINVASAIVTLSSGVKLSGQLASTVTGSKFQSNSAGTQRKLTMLATSTQSISATNNIDATDIDSGDGLPIISEGAVLSNTNNWYSSAGTLTNFFMAW